MASLQRGGSGGGMGKFSHIPPEFIARIKEVSKELDNDSKAIIIKIITNNPPTVQIWSLFKELGITRNRMTKSLNLLEKKGLIEKQGDIVTIQIHSNNVEVSGTKLFEFLKMLRNSPNPISSESVPTHLRQLVLDMGVAYEDIPIGSEPMKNGIVPGSTLRSTYPITMGSSLPIYDITWLSSCPCTRCPVRGSCIRDGTEMEITPRSCPYLEEWSK